ncbi:MAG TPA: hypothetical protein VF525_18005 [Pyrinomonadaceae bacterium]|jgi:response regulator RpfG family c-di-GMP phosphodiesterase
MWMDCDDWPRVPHYRYNILYLGTKRAPLVTYLNRELKEISCNISYAPSTGLSHKIIATFTNYDLLMFDEQLPEATGAELVEYARTLPWRAGTPCLVVPTDATPENSGRLVEQIREFLVPAGAK